MKKDVIKETLSFKELTDEEKTSRGILGRLYGPCADFINPTRNGRYYNDELWEKVFNENELVKEAFDNGGIPGELDHPAGREEIDSSKIAIMMPEPPKRDKDGHLIAYFDILDTPNGRIAYALAKYGYKLGISSRGTGDVIGDEVDPDTYDFKCFDLVITPSVKDARLSMSESLDTTQLQLKKALTESLEHSNEDEKKVMEETLDRLNIKLEEKKLDVVDTDNRDIQTTELKLETEDTVEVNPVDLAANAIENNSEDVEKSTEEFNSLVKDTLDGAKLNESQEEETSTEEVSEETTEQPVEEVTEDSPYIEKIKEFLGLVYDGDTAPTDEETTAFVDAFKAIFPEECFSFDSCADKEESETSEETVSEPEEANDEGSDELIKSLQDALTAKSELEGNIKSLQEQLAVSDTEVNKLKEENSRYKASIIKISDVAHNSKTLQEKVNSLEEELKIKDSKIQTLVENKESTTKSLNESLNNKDTEISKLTESLSKQKESYDSQIKQLNEKLETSQNEVKSKSKLVEQWQSFARDTINSYIDIQATMLGCEAEDIKSRLPKKYDIKDVERICEGLKQNSLNMKNLPFELGSNKSKIAKVQLKESQNDRLKVPSLVDDDVDSSLLELAEKYKR